MALKAPWSALTHPVVLIVIAVLLLIEITVDKIPAVDTVNDIIQTFIRPAAGDVLFAASGNVISRVSPVLAMVCGLLVAFGVHAAITVARPAVTAGTLGTANSVVSLAEDAVSGVTTLISVLAPVLLAVLLCLAGVWLVRRGASRKAGR